MKTLPILAATAAIALTAAPALAANYTTATATFTGLGDTIGSPFDQITLNAVTGTASGTGTYLVNTVDFLVGVNATADHIDSGSFTNTATVDGAPFSYTVLYQIDIGTTDTILIGGNSFRIGADKVTFNQLSLTSGVGTVSGDLTATVSAAPEPSTWLLMFAGIGGIGLMLRRAKKTMGFQFKDAFSA